MTTGSVIFLSSLPAESAVNARAAEAVEDETPEKSLPCITVSCPILRWSSSLIIDSRARHFLSNRRHRSQASEVEDHVHYNPNQYKGRNLIIIRLIYTFCRATTHSSHLFWINGRARRVRLLKNETKLMSNVERERGGAYLYCAWSGEPEEEGSEIRADGCGLGAIGTWILLQKSEV